MTKQASYLVLEQLRKRLLLTQGGMAALLGVTRQTYNNWIRGRNRPRGPQRDKLKDTLEDVVRLLRSGQWPAPGVRAKDPKTRLALLVAKIKASSGEADGTISLPGEGPP